MSHYIAYFSSLVIAVYLLAFILYLGLRSPRFHTPEHILQEHGDEIRILHSPFARLWPSLGKVINRESVATIQKADGMVTIFEKSSNAVDISLPKKHTTEIFNRAELLFADAEQIIINN